MSTVEVLQAARALISDPARWTQGWFAKDRWACPVTATDEAAVCWCAMGALQNVVGVLDLTPPGWAELNREARYIARVTVDTFNDTHEHAEVLAVFDQAIARLERAPGV